MELETGQLLEETVLAALRRAARHSDGLARISDVAFELGVRRELLEPVLRSMEERGLLICTPRVGAVSVLAPTANAGK